MARPQKFVIMLPETSKVPSTQPNNDRGGLIQSPQINSSGEPTQRSVRDVGQGRDIVWTLIGANRRRQIINSRIMSKYNAERPYDSKRLEDEGLGWRSNFTTKPLSQMIDKVAPRFEEAIDGLKYLTNSALDVKWANSAEKTEKFREKITETIRSSKGWKTLISDIALDNAMFGHTIVAWLDEFSWMPFHFAQEESFVPDGTKQCSRDAQVAVLLETYLPHELFDYIRDKEAAEAVGWNVSNTINAINVASPTQLRNQLTGSGTQEMWYQNAERELTIGSSYQAGASVISVYSLLVREVTGKVSHYRFASEDGTKDKGTLLFDKADRFDSMEDCLSFFTFQKGNKKLHGSKGIGRDIYELAGMLDRMRNEVVDRGILSGKTIVQGDFKFLHRFKMSVVGATVIVPNGWTFLEQKVDGNIENFLKLDAYFGMLVDQLIGSVSPRTFQGDRVTKAEVDLFASREEEAKDAKIRRFMEQFADMIGTMQRRLCDPKTTDAAAKAMQKELLETMTREELDEISKKPVAGTVRDLTPLQRQMISVLVAEKRGNPLYNQRALEVEDLTARAGSEYVKKLLLPENDPTQEAEQQRMQLLEMNMLQSGQPVPVSPRDAHAIHLGVLLPAAETIAQGIMDGNVGTETFEAIVQHVGDHYNYAVQAGEDKAGLAEAEQFLKNAGPVLAQLKELDAQAEQLAAAAQEQEPEAQPTEEDLTAALGAGTIPPA